MTGNKLGLLTYSTGYIPFSTGNIQYSIFHFTFLKSALKNTSAMRIDAGYKGDVVRTVHVKKV